MCEIGDRRGNWDSGYRGVKRKGKTRSRKGNKVKRKDRVKKIEIQEVDIIYVYAFFVLYYNFLLTMSQFLKWIALLASALRGCNLCL